MIFTSIIVRCDLCRVQYPNRKCSFTQIIFGMSRRRRNVHMNTSETCDTKEPQLQSVVFGGSEENCANIPTHYLQPPSLSYSCC